MLFLKQFLSAFDKLRVYLCVCVLQKLERATNLMIFTIYVISLPEQSSRTFAIIRLYLRYTSQVCDVCCLF